MLVTCFLTMLGCFNMQVFASLEKTSANESNDYKIVKWQEINDNIFVPKEIAIGNYKIKYTYDKQGILTSKVDKNGNKTTYKFTTKSDVIMLENQTNYYGKVEYLYNDNYSAYGFIYNNEKYTYTYENDMITEINRDNQVVGKYIYNVDGEIIDVENYTDEQICNVNNLAGRTDLYDRDMEWYYSGGRFYSQTEGFINNYDSIEYLEETVTPYVMSTSTYAKVVEDMVKSDINIIQQNKNFGKKISYLADGEWIKNISSTGKYKEIETIARTIYGEFAATPKITTIMTGDFDSQREAIMWVIQNRIGENSFGVKTPYQAVIKKGQFSSLTGTLSDTKQAREPNTSYNSWSYSYTLACYLYEVNSGSYSGTTAKAVLLKLIPKPAGITSQVYFASYDRWVTKGGYNLQKGTFTDSDNNVSKVYNIANNVGNIEKTGNNTPAYNIFFNKK